MVLNGAVHNAGRSGHRGMGLNMDGTTTSDHIDVSGLNKIYNDTWNSVNVQAIKANFNSPVYIDNYGTNWSDKKVGQRNTEKYGTQETKHTN